MSTFNDVFDAAQALPPNDRLRLIDALCDSFPPSEWPRPSEEWIGESERRSAAYDSGEMSASPWPEVRARARKKAGLDG
jgi:putative addiction module component (TIGR02574 family)